MPVPVALSCLGEEATATERRPGPAGIPDPLLTELLSLSLSTQAAERGHGDICSLLLQHSPALKTVRDRKARLACDLLPGNSALRDLLAS